MNIDSAFPSRYLKAGDLGGKTVRLKITGMSIEAVGKEKENRPVLSFNGTEKTLVLNKTNANTITTLYGRETDNWIGKDIDLYAAQVEFQGQIGPALRVRGVAQARPGQTTVPPIGAKVGGTVTGHLDAPSPASEADYGTLSDELDDEIPF